jgi:hypothetical protein
MRRVTGISGIFFKSEDPNSVNGANSPVNSRFLYRHGAAFEVREIDNSRKNEAAKNGDRYGLIFRGNTKYFDPVRSNYRVDDLDAPAGGAERTACNRIRTAKLRLRQLRLDYGSRRQSR